MALVRIERENPGTRIPPVAGHIQALLENEEASTLAQITAVQLTGELALKEYRAVLQKMALAERHSSAIRIAALGTLGRIGVDHDANILIEIATLASDAQVPIARAARATLRKLQASQVLAH